MSIFSTIEVLQRLRKVADVTTNKELSVVLGINEKTLSGWSNRNSMPIETILEAAKKYKCDLNWLLLGESKEQKLDTSERMLLTAFADLDDSQKMQAVLFLGNLASGNPTAQNGGVSQSVSHSKVENIAGGNVQQGARIYFEDDE
ncbi:helix-turn-helix domain-containing protein [Mannheimia sp. E30BD]|uniref:helix-turn-helix domain-containing protein n=1 Tax=Mannheimia sp. E30BD TaxID=3278708 RepID=UPI00359EF38A